MDYCSFIAAVFAGISVWQNFNARRTRFSFTIERFNPIDPGVWKWSDISFTCENIGERPERIVAIEAFDARSGRIDLGLQGVEIQSHPPEILAPREAFYVWFKGSSVVSRDAERSDVRFVIVLSGGRRYKSAPLHKLLGKLRVDEQPLKA